MKKFTNYTDLGRILSVHQGALKLALETTEMLIARCAKYPESKAAWESEAEIIRRALEEFPLDPSEDDTKT